MWESVQKSGRVNGGVGSSMEAWGSNGGMREPAEAQGANGGAGKPVKVQGTNGGVEVQNYSIPFSSL